MSNKLFVGGLSWDTNDEGLKNAFGQHGPVVEAKVVPIGDGAGREERREALADRVEECCFAVHV